MPANVVQRILTQAEPDMRKQINEILRYPEDSAGSIMTTEYVSPAPEYDGRGSDFAHPAHGHRQRRRSTPAT